MKLCPACQRTYEDDALRFCLEDGTALVSAEGSAYDPGATIKIPAPRVTGGGPTEVMGEDQPAATRAAAPKTPARKYGSPAETAPSARRSSAAPWILGAAVVLGLSAIAVAVIMTRGGGGGTDNTQLAQGNQNASPSGGVTPESTPGLLPRPDEGGNPASSPTQTSGGIGSGSGTGSDSKTPERPSPAPRQTPTERPTPPEPTATPPPSRPGGPPISGGVLNGKAISLPKPTYPPIAKAVRASGTVTVQVTIDESGNVIAARAVSGHPLLQQSAVQAARQARFSPTMLAGTPVKVTGVITYNFVAQ
jgi:TonB family protein